MRCIPANQRAIGSSNNIGMTFIWTVFISAENIMPAMSIAMIKKIAPEMRTSLGEASDGGKHFLVSSEDIDKNDIGDGNANRKQSLIEDAGLPADVGPTMEAESVTSGPA